MRLLTTVGQGGSGLIRAPEVPFLVPSKWLRRPHLLWGPAQEVIPKVSKKIVIKYLWPTVGKIMWKESHSLHIVFYLFCCFCSTAKTFCYFCFVACTFYSFCIFSKSPSHDWEKKNALAMLWARRIRTGAASYNGSLFTGSRFEKHFSICGT